MSERGARSCARGSEMEGAEQELLAGEGGRAGRMTSFPHLPRADTAPLSPSARGGCC